MGGTQLEFEPTTILTLWVNALPAKRQKQDSRSGSDSEHTTLISNAGWRIKTCHHVLRLHSGSVLKQSRFCLLPNSILYYTEEKGFHSNSQDGHSRWLPTFLSFPTPSWLKSQALSSKIRKEQHHSVVFTIFATQQWIIRESTMSTRELWIEHVQVLSSQLETCTFNSCIIVSCKIQFAD